MAEQSMIFIRFCHQEGMSSCRAGGDGFLVARSQKNKKTFPAAEERHNSNATHSREDRSELDDDENSPKRITFEKNNDFDISDDDNEEDLND